MLARGGHHDDGHDDDTGLLVGAVVNSDGADRADKLSIVRLPDLSATRFAVPSLGASRMLRFFSAGGDEVSAKVMRGNTSLDEGQPFDPTGTFTIEPDRNDLEDLWMNVDWAGAS